MSSISFAVSQDESRLINTIIDRYAELMGRFAPEIQWTRIDAEMDLKACHANGCRLDLDRLIDFPDFDFMHDMCGIGRNLNRRTGEIENGFSPRCAKK